MGIREHIADNGVNKKDLKGKKKNISLMNLNLQLNLKKYSN